MRRKKLSKSKSKRLFRKTARKVNSRNKRKIMRGGIRF